MNSIVKCFVTLRFTLVTAGCICALGACSAPDTGEPSHDQGGNPAMTADASASEPDAAGGPLGDAGSGVGSVASQHARFAHTQFGATPDSTNADWAYGAPAYRFTLGINAGDTMKSRDTSARSYVYGQHWNALYTSPPGTSTAWADLAATWASENGADVEDIFVHAASGQTTFSAPIASLAPFDATTSTLTLGKASDGHQVLTSGYKVGDTLTISGTSDASYDGAATVKAIVSSTVLRVQGLSTASSTGGKIGFQGNATKSMSNRIRVFAWTDWRYVLNPGSAAGRAFSIYRFGLMVGSANDGVFWDSTSSATIPGPSLEYASSGTYLEDILTLLRSYRATYPGKDSIVNIAGYTSDIDAQLADAAGGCQMEGYQSLFTYDHWLGSRAPFVVARAAAGTNVELTAGDGFDQQVPHAGVIGLGAAFRASGGSLYATADERAMMANYAAYLLVVDPELLISWDPANAFWDVLPLSARWYAAFEYPIGKPQGPAASFASVPASAGPGGTTVTIDMRVFSASGAAGEAATALVLYREHENSSTVFDATTAYTHDLPPAPAGKSWFLLHTDGSLASVASTSVALQHIDGAIFVAR